MKESFKFPPPEHWQWSTIGLIRASWCLHTSEPCSPFHRPIVLVVNQSHDYSVSTPETVPSLHQVSPQALH